MQLRHPAWTEKGFVVEVNGLAVPETKAGSYAVIQRTWKTGDVVEVQMPFQLHTEGFQDNPNRRAVMNGPIVLAAIVPTTVIPPAPATRGGRGAPDTNQAQFPRIKGEWGAFLNTMKPVAGKANTFTASAEAFQWPEDATAGELMFEPLYKIYDKRYMVYFDRAE
jgi:hypothetical protein